MVIDKVGEMLFKYKDFVYDATTEELLLQWNFSEDIKTLDEPDDADLATLIICELKLCIQKLDEYDQCGVTNVYGWWCGNFWWSNLSYIKSNAKPDKGDRWYFEAWLNRYRNPSIHEYYHFDFNSYYSSLPLDIHNKELYKDSKIEVISAYYGTLGEQQDEGKKIVERVVVDVTEEIKTNLVDHNNKGFCVRVDNNIAGDPHYGYEKVLEIYFTIDGEEYIITADENRNLKFEL
jgi:hypothetical protein